MEPARETVSDGAHVIFAQQVAIYRRVVEADYMSHRAFFGLLHDVLQARRQPFSFLDLACGDASCSVNALAGTQVSDYTAVDISEPALRRAQVNVLRLACGARTILADFQEFLKAPSRTWDVVFIGFSYHHLADAAKSDFARSLRAALRAAGEWIFFEPMLSGGQTRAQYLERWQKSLEEDWDEFDSPEKAMIWEHVASYDFPETPESFEEIVRKAGFRAFEHLYTDPFGFYGAFRALA